MSKRKARTREDRRRPAIEINLLSEQQERGAFVRARRGCSLPFLGGLLLIILLVPLLVRLSS